MSDRERGGFRDREEPLARESSLSEVVDLAGRRIMSGLIVAGLAVGIGTYSARPRTPNYQIVATDTGVARVNTRNGSIVTCQAGRCFHTMRAEQRLERAAKQAELEAAQTQRALAAPAQAPAAQAPAAQPVSQPAQPANPAPAKAGEEE